MASKEFTLYDLYAKYPTEEVEYIGNIHSYKDALKVATSYVKEHPTAKVWYKFIACVVPTKFEEIIAE